MAWNTSRAIKRFNQRIASSLLIRKEQLIPEALFKDFQGKS